MEILFRFRRRAHNRLVYNLVHLSGDQGTQLGRDGGGI